MRKEGVLRQYPGKTTLKEQGNTRGILRAVLGDNHGNSREVLRIKRGVCQENVKSY